MPHLTKAVHTPRLLVLLYEVNAMYRQIFIDGRPQPEDPLPSWNGYSTSKWQGDTLVVESTGFNGRAWLDQAGYPASESFRLIERYRRRDFGHMDLEMILEDPGMYTRPWSIFVNLVFQADTELIEFICEENEKDSALLVGK